MTRVIDEVFMILTESNKEGREGIEIDEFGWVSIMELLMYLSVLHKWDYNFQYTDTDLRHDSESDHLFRFEYNENMTYIRATYGHKYKVKNPGRDAYNDIGDLHVALKLSDIIDTISEVGISRTGLSSIFQYIHLYTTKSIAFEYGITSPNDDEKCIMITIDGSSMVNNRSVDIMRISGTTYIASEIPGDCIKEVKLMPAYDMDDEER